MWSISYLQHLEVPGLNFVEKGKDAVRAGEISVSYDIMSVFTCLPATDYMVVCTLKRVKEAGTRLVCNEGGPILKWNHCVISYKVHIKGPVLET